MDSKTPLKRWMDKKGITYTQLAQELGFSYEYIYKIAEGKDEKYMTDSFQMRFLKRFGATEASSVFTVAIPN